MPEIVAELARRLDSSDASDGNTRALEWMLALQSDEVLAANLGSYLDRLETAGEEGMARVAAVLVGRLDAMGPRALTVLEARIRRDRNYALEKSAGAICRLGPDARPIASAIREIAHRGRGGRQSRAKLFSLYVAALGIGDADLASDLRARETNERMITRYGEARAAAEAGDRAKLCRLI